MCNQLANNGFEANGFKNVARIALGINATTIAIVAPFKTFKMNEPTVSFFRFRHKNFISFLKVNHMELS